MSGIDKIITRLQKDCDATCREIEVEAVAEAKKIMKDSEEQTEKELAALKREVDDKADSILDKAKSSAALESRQALLKAKVEMIDDVITKAKNKLHNIDEPSYFGMLKLLAERNAEPYDGIMFLSQRDLDRMPADFEASLSKISVSRVPCDIEDGFILKYGDVEINCTFEALVNSRKDELKSVASELLFS